jgi:hypothetical protein
MHGELDITMNYIGNLTSQVYQYIIKLKRLQWAVHVQRMEWKRIPKRILESIFIGKRPAGKPRKRWINAVEIGSREILKVRNWKRESLDRQIWRRYLKEAKARLRAVAP